MLNLRIVDGVLVNDVAAFVCAAVSVGCLAADPSGRKTSPLSVETTSMVTVDPAFSGCSLVASTVKPDPTRRTEPSDFASATRKVTN